MNSTHIIKTHQIIDDDKLTIINTFVNNDNNPTIKVIQNFIIINFDIDISIDQDIILGFSRDWSNLPGKADMLARPRTEEECAILLYIFNSLKLPVTISAGKTNLTGSATPNGGLIISTVNMLTPQTCVDNNKKIANVAVGSILENIRDEILFQSKRKLYYPVDPTSRKEALLGGIISCNASGFIPGDKGATRYWVNGISLILTNGQKICATRGEYISKNTMFLLQSKSEENIINVPKYKRPKIKNASGPYTAYENDIDFVDLIVGSEGCFGMITEAQLSLKDKPKNYVDLFICLKSETDALQFYNYICKMNDINNFTAFEYFGYNCQNYMKHHNYFFQDKEDVGIYFQYPIYDKTLESEIEYWFNLINDFPLDINLNNVISLNDARNWGLFFEARHSMPTKALEKTKELDAISMITDTIVPPDNFSSFLDYTHLLLQKNNIEYLLFGHLGDCHLHFHLIYNTDEQYVIDNLYRKIIKKSSDLDGVYSAEHGTGKRKTIDFIECYGMNAVDEVKVCKMGFDPNLILNIGNIVSYE